MPRTFLCDANAGDYLEDVFVLTGKQLSTTQTGKPFIKANIGDRTRTVPARMWNASQGIFNAMPDGGFLRVAGKVETYQENIQFIIDRFWLIDDPTEVVIADLLPTTKKNVDEMFAQMTVIVRKVRNKHLRAIIDAYLDDAKLMDDFRRSPAAMSFHHAFVGGLLEHTLNMLQVGEAICPLYPGINRDLVIAGIFLHDIAKTWELTYHAGFGYSDGGHLVGHIVKSAVWVEHKAAIAGQRIGETISPALVDVLQHLILAHHGEPEFGAAKVPATPEAILIHYIDNIDAKMTMSLAVTRGDNVSGEASFTDFQKALGVRLYRPDVAPADMMITEDGAIAAPATPIASVAESIAVSATSSQREIVRDEEPIAVTNPLFAMPRK